jgi:hypothetical protein
MKAIALDMADVTGDPHIVDARLTDYFNLELAALSDLLISADENYFCVRKAIELRAGVSTYDLPSNYYHTIKTWHITNGAATDDRYPMAQMPLDELGWDSGPRMRLRTGALRYAVVGSENGPQLVLSRRDASGQVELWYVPQFADLQTDEQRISPNIPNGFEDWVMHGVAIRCRVKEESDTQQLEAKRAEILARITALMSPRDHGESRQVVDYYATHGEERYGRDYSGWGY